MVCPWYFPALHLARTWLIDWYKAINDWLTIYQGKIFHFPSKPARVGNTLERSWKLQTDRPYKLFEIRINYSVWKQLEEDVKTRNFKLQSGKSVCLVFGIKKMSCYLNVQKPGTVTWRSFIGEVCEVAWKEPQNATWPARGKGRGKSSQEQIHPQEASLNVSISEELLQERSRARA